MSDVIGEPFGLGRTVRINDREYRAYPLTCHEYLKYLAMRPDVRIVEENGTQRLVYDSKEDEAKELKASLYVLFVTLKKNDDVEKSISFSDWLDNIPATVISEYQVLITAVLEQSFSPLEKKT